MGPGRTVNKLAAEARRPAMLVTNSQIYYFNPITPINLNFSLKGKSVFWSMLWK